jgi:hypothetical protein
MPNYKIVKHLMQIRWWFKYRHILDDFASTRESIRLEIFELRALMKRPYL